MPSWHIRTVFSFFLMPPIPYGVAPNGVMGSCEPYLSFVFFMPPILTNCLLIFLFPFYYLPKQKEDETKDKGRGRRTKDEEETKDEDEEETKYEDEEETKE